MCHFSNPVELRLELKAIAVFAAIVSKNGCSSLPKPHVCSTEVRQLGAWLALTLLLVCSRMEGQH